MWYVLIDLFFIFVEESDRSNFSILSEDLGAYRCFLLSGVCTVRRTEDKKFINGFNEISELQR